MFDYLKSSVHNSLLVILYMFSYHFWSGVDSGYNLRGCLSCGRSELSLMGIWGLALLKLLYFLRWNSKLQLFLLPTDDNLVQSGAMWVTGIEFRLVCPIINGMYLIYAHQWWLPSSATDWTWLLLLLSICDRKLDLITLAAEPFKKWYGGMTWLLQLVFKYQQNWTVFLKGGQCILKEHIVVRKFSV